MQRRLSELALLRRLKPGLFVHDDEALNAEAAPHLLDEALTPLDAFFIRNNGELPQDLDAAGWTLTVDGEVEAPAVYSLAELRARFETVTVTAVIECAGNGRFLFQPPTDGVPWRLGAVGCARWTGVRLADLLAAARPHPGAVYTGHHSPDSAIGAPGKPALSRGLPIAKALAPETLVAFAMNGEPLTPLHGAPLRIVAPGFPGSAWQKWLSRISLRDREHDGAKMGGTDYRMPASAIAPGEPIDPATFAVITDMPVKSLITTPADGFRRKRGKSFTFGGYAWSGHVPVAGLRISPDGGASWREVALAPAEGRFAWRRFALELSFDKAGPVELLAQARDEAGTVQPLHATWNPRGYCNNEVHRVRGTIE